MSEARVLQRGGKYDGTFMQTPKVIPCCYCRQSDPKSSLRARNTGSITEYKSKHIKTQTIKRNDIEGISDFWPFSVAAVTALEKKRRHRGKGKNLLSQPFDSQD